MTRSVHPVSVSVAGLGYHYPDGVLALSAVDLNIAAGERIALLGRNGAGKSTLLLHLAALLPERTRYLHRHAPRDTPHQHGVPPRVVIDGVDVSHRTLRHVRERVGIVFSESDDQLIGLTVREEVEYGPRARGWTEDEIHDATQVTLAAVGLSGFEDRSPHHLSAGEKRRLCLASVLVYRPGLLLFDEPSSGLDPRGRRELADLLNELPATQVIASHDLEFVARLCPRAIVLDHGAVVAQGPTVELLAHYDLLRAHGLM
jgi:cobalt/nickel transport system ATP-binding protein